MKHIVEQTSLKGHYYTLIIGTNTKHLSLSLVIDACGETKFEYIVFQRGRVWFRDATLEEALIEYNKLP